MGALLWLAKMLLKVMKPFLQIAFIESIKEVLEDFIAGVIEDEFGGSEDESTTVGE